jgi:hypothetical protein
MSKSKYESGRTNSSRYTNGRNYDPPIRLNREKPLESRKMKRSFCAFICSSVCLRLCLLFLLILVAVFYFIVPRSPDIEIRSVDVGNLSPDEQGGLGIPVKSNVHLKSSNYLDLHVQKIEIKVISTIFFYYQC